jgi:hypothetical protein
VEFGAVAVVVEGAAVVTVVVKGKLGDDPTKSAAVGACTCWFHNRQVAMNQPMTPDDEYEFYARPENQEGTARARTPLPEM